MDKCSTVLSSLGLILDIIAVFGLFFTAAKFDPDIKFPLKSIVTSKEDPDNPLNNLYKENGSRDIEDAIISAFAQLNIRNRGLLDKSKVFLLLAALGSLLQLVANLLGHVCLH